MRELLLIVIVGVISVLGLFRPKVGLLGYIWFALMRPDILSFSAGLPYSLVLAIATLCGCVRLLPRAPVLLRTPMTVGLLLLMVPLVLSAFFAVNPALSMEPLAEFCRIVLMALLIPVVFQDVDDLRWVFLVIAFSIGSVGFKFGAWGLAAGGARFNSGVGGMMSDNNTMATGLAMGLPFCWYSIQLLRSRLAKAGMLALAVASLSAIVMTHSRGGALAALAVLTMIAFRSRRKIITSALLILFTLPAVYLVWDSYSARLSTLEDVRTESSAASRIVLAKAAWRMSQDYPLLGVGFGGLNERAIVAGYVDEADNPEARSDFVIHNTYLQMLADSGFFAFFAYIALLFGTIGWLWLSAKRVQARTPGLEVYPQALQAALVAFAVGTISLSQVRFDFFYMAVTTAAVWYWISREMSHQFGIGSATVAPGVSGGSPYSLLEAEHNG